MTTLAKTVIATGASSGLGFEVIKQLLLDQPNPFKFILGVRDPAKTKPEFDNLKYDTSKHDVSLFQVDYANLKEVRAFAQNAIEQLGKDKLDYVMLNHAVARDATSPGLFGSAWCDSFVVNHQSHHYLLHLLREPITRSHSRVVFVSSGAVRGTKETNSLRAKMQAGSGTGASEIYSATKFSQLLGAHHWRRVLKDQATVVAVSPGMIPGTNLMRHYETKMSSTHADAKDVPTGAKSILRAFDRTDFPADPNAIFLTSWGEWWDPNEIYPLSLDTKLQDEFCPPQEEIEREARL
ncbi:MAG: hypothetical protein TREMPRED_005942 [Tremellales sp. Tagirdzhanova-0007]|nr:MAG: hypothetical protein TREMPRED_005942 [Tremellales sp. Tagirdzhanova-0007]